MLIRDIDRKLDMRLVLRVRENTELFNAFQDFNSKLPVFIYHRDNETWMKTYIPNEKGNTKIPILLKKFRDVELDEAYVIDGRINNLKDLEIINTLSAVPSFLINRSDIDSGFLNVYARFHSLKLDEVSEILSEYTMDRENARIGWLGPSMGISSIIGLINADYPISLITFQLPMEREDEFLNSIKSDYILEASHASGKNGAIICVI